MPIKNLSKRNFHIYLSLLSVILDWSHHVRQLTINKNRTKRYNTYSSKTRKYQINLNIHQLNSTFTLATALLMELQGFGIICLMMCVRPLLCILSEGSSRPFSLHKHTHPSFFSSLVFLSEVLTPAMSQDYDYWFSLLFGALRVYHQMEIRRYKNIIRIRIFLMKLSYFLLMRLYLLLQVIKS